LFEYVQQRVPDFNRRDARIERVGFALLRVVSGCLSQQQFMHTVAGRRPA
jgi:hypothetical protein